MKKNFTSILSAIFLSFLLLTFPAPAFAYIDPSSGSLLVQILFGGFAGLLVAIKLFWTRIPFPWSKPKNPERNNVSLENKTEKSHLQSGNRGE